MITLAMELSTRRGSAALFIDDELRSNVEWEAGRKSGSKLFQSVQELLEKSGIGLEEVNTFAVGRGPGNYSGMRVTMTAANSFALPGSNRVFAISSGEALAAQASQEQDANHVLVLGDARKNSIWMGFYTAGRKEHMDWKVVDDENELLDVPEDTLLVSSDWERIEDSPLVKKYAHHPRKAENLYPSAGTLGALVQDKIRQNLPSEDLTPIYTQPPVLLPKT